MTEHRASVTIEGKGDTSSSPKAGLAPHAVAQALERLSGQQGVTVTVLPEGSDERLLVAIDGSRAFLGLERRDGLFQFVADETIGTEATQPFTIGGQETSIEGRYQLAISLAADVVEEWLSGRPPTGGAWERQ